MRLNKITDTHKQADQLFRQAVREYERGNGSHSSAIMARCDKRMDQLHAKAFTLLVELHGPDLRVAFPGLYPVFRLGERDFHSVEELAQWAPLAAQA